SLSAQIARLQDSPGRLLQSLEHSSLEVWENSNSGVGADSSTVSYYVKGEIVGFLLDARIRRATDGRRSLEDVMRLAYRRYGGERGFTPEEFRATTEEVAGVDLREWFRKALASTEELDYSEALEWFGLRFEAEGAWSIDIREDATEDQSSHLQALLASAGQGSAAGQDAQRRRRGGEADTPSTLGLDQGFLDLETPRMKLKLVKASQTVAALQPKDADGFDFTPGDWLERREGDGFFHLGDLTFRLRIAGSDRVAASGRSGGPTGSDGADGADTWREYSTAAARKPVEPLPVSGLVLAAAELAPTLPSEIPLQVRRFWEVDDGHLALRFELRNKTDRPVEIGSLGIPMVFNNILADRSLEEAHSVSSFHDPYIGQDAGYLQVTRLSGHGPALVVVPQGRTPFEAYNPLLTDPTRRGVTFEGFYEWMAHSRAHAE
ncbi:MAG: hypothetical protein KAJ42_12115, partial [Gemmatimonadetes bacterium]|nr:hypothetical protein [Gemmatimonadota bacterium]